MNELTIEPVDLLVFGPHPDDIEIGMGGTVARHVALGHRVGLCDLTAGEMGSNGTVEERLAEADAAAELLGVSWRVNLRLARSRYRLHTRSREAVAAVVRRARPRTVALPYWSDRHPDHVAASALSTEAVFNAGLRRFRGGRRGLEAGVDVLLLHQRSRGAVVRRGRQRTLRDQAPRAGLPRQPVRASNRRTRSRRA